MVANAYDLLDFMQEKHESSNRPPFEHSSRLTEGAQIPSVFDFIGVSLNRYIKNRPAQRIGKTVVAFELFKVGYEEAMYKNPRMKSDND